MGKRRKPIDFDDKRLYYSLEVADHFAVNVSFTFLGKNSITSIPKTAGGTRQYKEDIRQVEIIYHLVEKKD